MSRDRTNSEVEEMETARDLQNDEAEHRAVPEAEDVLAQGEAEEKLCGSICPSDYKLRCTQAGGHMGPHTNRGWGWIELPDSASPPVPAPPERSVWEKNVTTSIDGLPEGWAAPLSQLVNQGGGTSEAVELPPLAKENRIWDEDEWLHEVIRQREDQLIAALKENAELRQWVQGERDVRIQELAEYHRQVTGWTSRALNAEAKLAAVHVAEPSAPAPISDQALDAEIRSYGIDPDKFVADIHEAVKTAALAESTPSPALAPHERWPTVHNKHEAAALHAAPAPQGEPTDREVKLSLLPRLNAIAGQALHAHRRGNHTGAPGLIAACAIQKLADELIAEIEAEPSASPVATEPAPTEGNQKEAAEFAELEQWLRDEAAKLQKQASSRREYGWAHRDCTDKDLDIAHSTAGALSGRSLPKKTRAEQDADGKVQERIATKLEAEAERLLRWAAVLNPNGASAQTGETK